MQRKRRLYIHNIYLDRIVYLDFNLKANYSYYSQLPYFIV